MGGTPRNDGAGPQADQPRRPRFDLKTRAHDPGLPERVTQCESLGEFAMAEHIREILQDEQEHLTDLATALGEDPPDLSRRR